jgi:hypothetical protein
MRLPADQGSLDSLNELWTDALRVSVPLTRRYLAMLVAAGLVPGEATMRDRGTGAADRGEATELPPFPELTISPASPIPRSSILERVAAAQPARTPADGRAVQATSLVAAATNTIGAQALLIQIIPHDNGEVFLSKRAVDQDHEFFGWPFTGLTVPKKATNPAYPQRVPDPVVDIRVYNRDGHRIIRHYPYNLNTVYYAPKSEIRITVPHDVVEAVPEYSLMVMRKPTAEADHDYDIEIFVPGSERFEELMAGCNQTMPTGGSAQARRFGWM